jgi:hypothetical protein
VHGIEYDINWVRLHLTNLGRIPNVIPVQTIWNVPASLDIPKLIYDNVLSLGYVENVWPCLCVVMGSSIDNVLWSAGVLTTIALFDTIRMLPSCTCGKS